MTEGSQRNDATRSLRRVRRAQLAVFALVGAALVATAMNGYVSAGRVYEAVALDQGRGLLQALRRSLGFAGPPSRLGLEAALDANEDLGLRCIVALPPARPGEKPTLSGAIRVGSCTMPDQQLESAVAAAPPGRLLDLGERVAMIDARPPPPPGHPPGPPPGAPWASGRGHRPPVRDGDPRGHGPPPPHHGGPDGDRGRPPPHRGAIAIEFEPVQANALRGAATTSLATAIAAVAALIAAGFTLARLSRRAEQLQESAERQRQLASLGTMSAVLAHEIRNPLASLKGHAQLLVETLEPEGREHAKASRVVREATRIEELSEDLLSLVRSSRIEAVQVDPASIVREVTQSLAVGRVAIDTSRAPRSWSLDPARMRQVLENLLRNALDAAPPEAPVEIVASTEPAGLVFTVRDRGPGIPPGDLERIFEPFVTGRVRGTGLGLAVARRIVDLHGGRISVRNRDGGGAEFRVVLP